MRIKNLKTKLQNGEKILGTFITSTDPCFTEAAAVAGFDFVIIDTEHGPLSPTEVTGHVRAAEAMGIPPVCRATNAETTTILRLLDVGVHGIQVPQVNDMVTAQQVVTAAKYYPEGNRGMALPRALEFGMGDLMASFRKANEETVVIVHCETKESLEVIDKIAALKGIDVIFLGPFDLSQSLGIPGQTEHPLIQSAKERVLKVCQQNQKAAGIFAANGEQAKKRMAEGFQFVAMNMDLTLYALKCQEEIKKVKGLQNL